MIAKVTQGGSFGGALDYLLNPKHKEQERAQEEREQERRQVKQPEVERAPQPEAKTLEEMSSKKEAQRAALDAAEWGLQTSRNSGSRDAPGARPRPCRRVRTGPAPPDHRGEYNRPKSP